MLLAESVRQTHPLQQMCGEGSQSENRGREQEGEKGSCLEEEGVKQTVMVEIGIVKTDTVVVVVDPEIDESGVADESVEPIAGEKMTERRQKKELEENGYLSSGLGFLG